MYQRFVKFSGKKCYGTLPENALSRAPKLLVLGGRSRSQRPEASFS